MCKTEFFQSCWKTEDDLGVETCDHMGSPPGEEPAKYQLIQ